MPRNQSYSQVSYPIVGGPHLAAGRLWSNGTFAGAFKHFNGLEKRTVMRSEDIHHTFDPVASGFDPAKDTVVDPEWIDPAVSTGETT